MPTGDSATLFWALVTLAATFGVGGYQLTGRKSWNLWTLCAGFLILALVLGFGIPAWTARYAAAAVQVVWTAYPLLTIVAVSLLIRGDRGRATGGTDFADIDAEVGKLPKFAVPPTTKWKPDITLRRGVGYLGAESSWREPHRGIVNSVDGTIQALIGALASNKITAWGREHPDEGELLEIGEAFWNRAEITLNTDYAFSHIREIGVYNVHLCQKEMEQVWPPKEG